jgi:DNA-binding GntR family transcriptional regulator
MHDLIMGEVELCIGQVQSQQLMSPTEIAAQHQAILDAVAAGDADTAGTITRDHIAGARDRLLAKWDSDHPAAPISEAVS